MKSFIKMIMQILRRLDYIVLYCFYCFKYQIVSHQVLFLSDSRETMSGNFLNIYNEIKDDYIVKKHLYSTSQVKHDKKAICKDMAQSHYILIDDFYPIIYPIPLRKQTRLIQVWHAMGAFKTVGFARKQNHDRFSMTHRHYTDTIVSSPAIREDYAKAFRMNVRDVHSIGIPRTDCFFDHEYIENKKRKLYLTYPQLKGKKVILFAPTFRGNNIHNGYYDYQQMDFKRFQEELSSEYMCIIKMHPYVQNQCQQDLDPSFYLDLTHEREINDFLMISDVLITDYSSVIFEASLLNIYTIFYAYDLNDYMSQRDFFYPYEEYTYGPVVTCFDELLAAVKDGCIDKEKLKTFKQKFTSSCDGLSTKRFVETLLKEK